MPDQAPSQAVLFEPDEDLALLCSPDTNRKRYTADQVDAIEWKRNAVLMLLASDWPVEYIARHLHVNKRTVMALAARSGEEVAQHTNKFASVCHRLGARWLGLAKTLEHDASFLQLVTAGAIAIDKGNTLAGMGQMGEESALKEAQDHVEAAAVLRRLMGPGGPSHDAASTDAAQNPQQIEALTARGVGCGVDRGPSDPHTSSGVPHDQAMEGGTPGGASGSGPGPERPTGPREGDSQPKEDLWE